MDLVQGATTLGVALLTVFGIFILVAGGYQAWKIMHEGERHILPTLISVVFAVSLCFGGAYYLTTLGAGNGAPALTL